MRKTREVNPNTDRESVNIETREIGIRQVEERKTRSEHESTRRRAWREEKKGANK
jgi:hypothetical protein